MSNFVVSLMGFLGAGLILWAYFQVSREAWNGRSVRFQLVNLVGAVLLVIYATVLTAYANVVLNGVWVVVALVSLLRARRLR